MMLRKNVQMRRRRQTSSSLLFRIPVKLLAVHWFAASSASCRCHRRGFNLSRPKKLPCHTPFWKIWKVCMGYTVRWTTIWNPVLTTVDASCCAMAFSRTIAKANLLEEGTNTFARQVGTSVYFQQGLSRSCNIWCLETIKWTTTIEICKTWENSYNKSQRKKCDESYATLQLDDLDPTGLYHAQPAYVAEHCIKWHQRLHFFETAYIDICESYTFPYPVVMKGFLFLQYDLCISPSTSSAYS